MPPLVSIIITVYRRTAFLEQAILSAVSQNFNDREIIVADDSGAGLAQSICEPFCKNGQCIYRANPVTLGIVGSLRGAIESASGKYIAILNDDDYWSPTFLEKLVTPLEDNSERVIAFSDHWLIRENGSVDEVATVANTRHYGRDQLAAGDIHDPVNFVLKKNGVPLAMASVFRKDDLNRSLLYRELVGSYDFWIACILAASGKKFYYVPERLTFYRLHSQMETARKSPDKNLPMIFIFEQILDHNWFPAMRPFLRHRLAEAHYRNGRDLLRFGQLGPARQMFRRANRVSWHQKSIASFLLSFAPLPIRRHYHLSD
jgi:glycosyltransferase involved in cell wall biosynthesis